MINDETYHYITCKTKLLYFASKIFPIIKVAPAYYPNRTKPPLISTLTYVEKIISNTLNLSRASTSGNLADSRISAFFIAP